MVQIDWQQVHLVDNLAAAIIVLSKVVRWAPALFARVLVPLLKFLASNLGKYAITDYLNDKYPSRQQRKNSRSSTN